MAAWVRDPVCGRPVDPRRSPWLLEMSDATLYFDSEACLVAFCKDPLRRGRGRVVMRLQVPATTAPRAVKAAAAPRPAPRVRAAAPAHPRHAPHRPAPPLDAPPSVAEPYQVTGPTVPVDPSAASVHSLLKH